MEVLNANPIVHNVGDNYVETVSWDYNDELECEHLTAKEVFEFIRHLSDPEHPLTLEQLHVVQLSNIDVNLSEKIVSIQFTPTIPHCSMATLIGLCIRVKLGRSLASKYKLSIQIFPGSHQSEVAVNKQLNDKERVAAALENSHLLDIVNKCIQDSDRQ